MLVNPQLSRFSPLERIITFDDFDTGLNGWTALIGNYEKSLDSMLPQYRDLRGPMLSNGTMWDTGSAGSWDGTYAMKVEGFEASQRAGARSFEGMKEADAEVWVTDCSLAAIQFEQHAGVRAMHPMSVLARAYREDGFGHTEE